MYLNRSCEKAFRPVDKHILKSYAKGVHNVLGFFTLKFAFKKKNNKKVGGRLIAVNQEKRERGGSTYWST